MTAEDNYGQADYSRLQLKEPSATPELECRDRDFSQMSFIRPPKSRKMGFRYIIGNVASLVSCSLVLNGHRAHGRRRGYGESCPGMGRIRVQGSLARF